MQRRLAQAIIRWAYRIAERIDRKSVPKVSPWAFTFERERGAVINDTGLSSDRRGARLMYPDDYDYERAWTDSATFASTQQ